MYPDLDAEPESSAERLSRALCTSRSGKHKVPVLQM
jgi:hypothetical protein